MKELSEKRQKNKGGRPTKYRLECCDVVLELMKKGFSKRAVASALGICRDTLYQWCRVNQRFSYTCEVGEAMSQKYWEEIGMLGMLGKIKGFKASVWIYIMKSRFGWRNSFPPDFVWE